MDDCLFIHLINSLFYKTTNQQIENIENSLEHVCCQLNSTDSSSVCKQCSVFYSKNLHKFRLKILNLSGCYRLTDLSLK